MADAHADRDQLDLEHFADRKTVPSIQMKEIPYAIDSDADGARWEFLGHS
jgi:hypothetical protein